MDQHDRGPWQCSWRSLLSAAAQPAQDPPPAVKPAAQSIWSSEGFTGDWGGARTDMKNKGVELELALYQFFQGVSFADQDTSPITSFLNLGLGGSELFAERARDEFGVAYAFTDLSDELKDNLDLIAEARLRAEHQVEIFYNAHLRPWFRLTGDLQIIRPTRPVADTAVVPGVRLGILF